MEYWLATTGPDGEPGINGAIMKRDGKNTTVNTVGVASFDAAAKKIKSSGGKVVMPKTAVPGIGWYAYCQDTEGNVFGIMENDANAK
jgi:predicted enzyme related to lactoylglutathione lyase